VTFLYAITKIRAEHQAIIRICGSSFQELLSATIITQSQSRITTVTYSDFARLMRITRLYINNNSCDQARNFRIPILFYYLSSMQQSCASSALHMCFWYATLTHLEMICDAIVRIHATEDIAVISVMSDTIFAQFNVPRDFPRNGHLTRSQYRGSPRPLKSKNARTSDYIPRIKKFEKKRKESRKELWYLFEI